MTVRRAMGVKVTDYFTRRALVSRVPATKKECQQQNKLSHSSLSSAREGKARGCSSGRFGFPNWTAMFLKGFPFFPPTVTRTRPVSLPEGSVRLCALAKAPDFRASLISVVVNNQGVETGAPLVLTVHSRPGKVSQICCTVTFGIASPLFVSFAERAKHSL